MTNYLDGDHALGLELQLVELVQQRNQATSEGRTDDVSRLNLEITELQIELGGVGEVEMVSTVPTRAQPVHPAPARVDAPKG